MTAVLPPPSQGAARGLARAGAIARRQWWVVVLCALVATLGAVGYSKEKKVTYTAGAIVTVTAPASSSTTSPSAAGTSLTPAAPNLSAAAVQRAAATAAQLPYIKLTGTSSATGTSVTIAATAPSPQQAILAANAAARVYAADQKHSYLSQAASYQLQINSLSAEINTLSKASRGAPIGSADKTKLTVLNSQLTTLLTDQYGPIQAASYVGVTTPASGSTVGVNAVSHKVMLIAFVAGLLAGLGVALIREQLDDKLRAASEITEGNHEVLAELPTSPALRRTGTIADDPAGQLAEDVRTLRTALRFLSVKRPIRTVLVTSSTGGDGKSFVALNLAAAWAMSGMRTILVSSDLRQPALEGMLGMDLREDGLSEAIADAALNARQRTEGDARVIGTHNGLQTRPKTELSLFDLDGLLMPTSVEGLMLLPAGPMPPNPAELLGSPQMADLMTELRELADVVVLDSPPVLAVTDALVLTAHADGVLFVAAQNRTSRGAVRRGLRALEGGMAPVLGVVLNRANRSEDTYYFRNRTKRLRRTARGVEGGRSARPDPPSPKHRAPRAARAAAQRARSISSSTTP